MNLGEDEVIWYMESVTFGHFSLNRHHNERMFRNILNRDITLCDKHIRYPEVQMQANEFFCPYDKNEIQKNKKENSLQTLVSVINRTALGVPSAHEAQSEISVLM